MTSSLVGSEMCIRDRVSQRASEDAPLGWWPLALRRQRHNPRSGWRASVSYTHLTLPTICSV
eukprot:283377-Prorocentrum_lima.AAC.1